MSELQELLVLQLFSEMTEIAVSVSPDPHDRLMLFYIYAIERKSRGTILATAKSISTQSNVPYETVRRRLKDMTKRGLLVEDKRGFTIHPKFDIKSIFQSLADCVLRYADQIKSA